MKRLEIAVFGGEFKGERFQVADGCSLKFGRSSSNDIRVVDEELSRNHCLFEASGETGLRVTDLASANGTFVNGESTGSESRELKAGDTVVAGSVTIKVVDPEDSAGVMAVDLGLETEKLESAAKTEPDGLAKGNKGHPPKFWMIVSVLLAVTLAAIVALIIQPLAEEKAAVVAASKVVEHEPEMIEFTYDKIDADSRSVFRYALTFDENGDLAAAVDDFQDGDTVGRQVRKHKVVANAASRQLAELLSAKALAGFDHEYIGPDSDPPVLHSRRLKVVYDTKIVEVVCQNVVVPEAFAVLCDRLEALSKNELGVWAINQSRSQLIALSEKSAELAKAKWEEREVEYGNIAAAIRAWREALFFLDTVNPKPEEFDGYRQRLDEAVAELQRRYEDHWFSVNRAVSLGDLDAAVDELKIVLSIIPDRDDARNQEAAAKLMDVEKRMKKGGAR